MTKPTQRGKTRWAVFVMLALAAASALLSYPRVWDRGADLYNAHIVDPLKLPAGIKLPYFKDIPFKLGLDLQGGTHLVYEADTKDIPESERAAALEGVRDVIERRVNAFGVSEPIVQTNKAGDRWRIVVELAGVRDVREAIRMIGETPILEFKEENNVADVPLTADEQKKLDTLNAEAKAKASQSLKDVIAGKGVTTWENLGLVTEAAQPELWTWADTHQTAKVPQLVESEAGWNIVRINARDTSEQEIKASHILICFQGTQGCEGQLTKEQAFDQITKLRAELTPENFAEKAKANSTDPSAETNGGDLGWFPREAMIKEFSDAAFAMKKGEISQPVETAFGWHIIYKVDERPLVRYDLDRILTPKATAADVRPPVDPWKNTGLSGKHVRRAQVEFDTTGGQPMVTLAFNEEGKQLFADITKRNVNKLVAIFLDGEPISIPRVQQEITEGTAVISGDFDFKEAKLLAQRLNAGALPVPIQLLSQQTIGASLGQDSLAKSLHAGLIGFLIVVAFMILYYRLPGLLAALALAMYTAFTLAVFKLWGITLTLSGIAGVILSIGMAVDANILIFERMKEELKNGRPLDSAINEGFKRAWTSIRDSNVSSLLTCVILYSFTSSSVRGFAVTLALGILISMFSAITVTRSLLRLTAPWVAKHRWLFK
ncbi:MAG TPA: protein translocase subunit SecD [Candidatus Baltobacteraceae bacterium]|nr:protein translocase subunit SecD [Candidatus Baltobacteraceae bacterium]